MREKCRFELWCVLLASAWIALPTFGQGDCARVSTDVTFFFGIDVPVPDPNHPFTVDLWHTDLELSFRPEGWTVVVSHDPPGAGPAGLDIEPVEALLLANPETMWLLSSIPPDFDFIGATPGEPFWVLPQNTFSAGLALGMAVELADSGRFCPWNPGDPRGAETEDLWFELKLLDVRGPADGDFSMWQADGVNPPVVFFSTRDGGITDKDVYYITDRGHAHMNWGFTQPGLYEIDFRVSTVLRCEEWLTADWAPLGNAYFNGDCKVDFLDFAHLAAHWLQHPLEDDPDTWMFLDPDNPADPVDSNDLTRLADQWLLCGYPGCFGDANDVDPNDLNDN